MGTLTTKPIALLSLVSLLACGGSTAKVSGDGGTHDDDGSVSPDAGTPPPHEDGGTPAKDAGAPEMRNDGGILNDAPPGACPATYAIAGSAGNCGTSDVFCIYDEGTCTCGEPGPPHEGPSNWFCSPLAAGCPYAPPTEGTACTGNAYCDYAACSGGTAWDCTGGVWTQGGVGCPN
jgi:hypothetical protein